MKLKDVDHYFKKLLSLDKDWSLDSGITGLQIGNLNSDIKKIAFCVDASLEALNLSVKEGADMLFVHHGIFWGEQTPIIKNSYDRISAFIKNGIALYAVHIPLDAHPLFGNNFQIAKKLSLNNIKPFGEYKGIKIGYKGVFKKEKTIDEILSLMNLTKYDCLSILDFGRENIKSVGIVSGGAPFEVLQAIDEGLDLFITGDASHAVYHACKEAKINLISAGHYRTETYGINAVQKEIEKTLKLKTVFLDINTKL